MSARYPSPPRVRPYATGAFMREGEDDPRKANRRSSTPDKYKPDKYKDASKRPTSSDANAPPPSAGKQDASAAASKPAPSPAAAAATSPPPPAAAGSSKSSSFMDHMPNAMLAYAGIKAVSKHADSAKEWINWLNDLNETPEEIEEMSAKATTARDTINQVRETLKARPDLVEGETGATLKSQIEDAVKDTDKALGKMTKLLSEISKTGAGEYGDAVKGMQSFWNSYRYKDEFKEKVEKANGELQKELAALSTLMVNIYS